MRSLSLPVVALSCTLSSACVTAPPIARFSAGEPLVRPVDRAAPSRVAPQLRQAFAASALEIAGCFDDLGARRNLTATVHVAVALQLRGGSLTVAQVSPRDPASVSDAELLRCIADLASGWAVHGNDADAEVALAVAPRVSAHQAAAVARALAPPAFAPEE